MVYEGVHESRRRSISTLVPVVLLALLIVAALAVPGVRDFFTRENLVSLLETAGWWAPIVFALIMALAIVVSPIPSVPISAMLGMAYGPLAGTAIAVCGATLGAMAAFGIARRFGNGAIRVFTGRSVTFCKGCSRRTLAVIVFVARLIPVVSFDLVSYGAGLSRMSFRQFVLWTFLGMIPWTWFYTSVGSAVLDNPVLAAVLSIVLAVVVLVLPAVVRRYNPFGLRRVMMEQEDERA